MFGADVSLQGQEEALTAAPRDAAPVPAASAVGQGPGTGHVALATAAAPVHHHIGDGDPPWLAGLRQSLLGDMREMRADQKEILTSVQEQRAEFRHMGQRLERVEGRQDDLRHRLDSMEKELREVSNCSVSAMCALNALARVGNNCSTWIWLSKVERGRGEPQAVHGDLLPQGRFRCRLLLQQFDELVLTGQSLEPAGAAQ
eukprot:s3925_g4.t2